MSFGMDLFCCGRPSSHRITAHRPSSSYGVRFDHGRTCGCLMAKSLVLVNESLTDDTQVLSEVWDRSASESKRGSSLHSRLSETVSVNLQAISSQVVLRYRSTRHLFTLCSLDNHNFAVKVFIDYSFIQESLNNLEIKMGLAKRNFSQKICGIHYFSFSS